MTELIDKNSIHSTQEEKPTNDNEFGQLSFKLRQEAMSSSLPNTTLSRRFVIPDSAVAQEDSGNSPIKEIDDKFVQWIGRVLDIEGNTFTARIDPIHIQSPSKIAKFDIQKIILLNGELLEEGATFYWTVGLFRNKKGSFERRSEVRFRLPIVPNYDAVDDLARQNAEKLFSGIGWLD